jgi:DNA-binding NtrC family response regulator
MKHKILFVDDEPQVLGGLKNALRKEPYEMLTATSGPQALEVLSSQPIDVVVSDEQMPGMSGSELLSLVRHKYPDTVRIILTGQASLDAAIRAINEGEVYRFLTKPCSPVDLAFTIRHALQLKNLARESSQLLMKTRKQQAVLRDLEKEYPGITEVKRDPTGAMILEEENIDIDDLINEIRDELRQDPSSQ